MGDSIYFRHENNVYTQDEIIWKVGEKKCGFGDVGRVCYRDRRDCQLLPAVVRILIPMERERVDMKGNSTLSRFFGAIHDTNFSILHIHLYDPECQNKEFLQKERNNSIHYQPECVCWILYENKTHLSKRKPAFIYSCKMLPSFLMVTSRTCSDLTDTPRKHHLVGSK